MEIATSKTGRVSLTVFFWLLVIFLYLPIAVLALFSFNDGDPSFPLEGFTTHWYGDVLSNDILVGALGRSAAVAAISRRLPPGEGLRSATRRSDPSAGRPSGRGRCRRDR